jgi:hypothetical protein
MCSQFYPDWRAIFMHLRVFHTALHGFLYLRTVHFSPFEGGGDRTQTENRAARSPDSTRAKRGVNEISPSSPSRDAIASVVRSTSPQITKCSTKKFRQRRRNHLEVLRPSGIGVISVAVALPHCVDVRMRLLGHATFKEIAAKGLVGSPI